MRDIAARDFIYLGNHPDGVEEYESSGELLDPRPKRKPLTLEKYLKELYLSQEQYENKF